MSGDASSTCTFALQLTAESRSRLGGGLVAAGCSSCDHLQLLCLCSGVKQRPSLWFQSEKGGAAASGRGADFLVDVPKEKKIMAGVRGRNEIVFLVMS